MGTLLYGPERVAFEFDDELLAHLEALLSAKLRRNEAFFLNWTLPREQGSGRICLWLHPSVPLMFRYKRGTKKPQLSAQLVQSLAAASASSAGLDLSEYLVHGGSGRPAPNIRPV
jgi:hypothetical protein